MPFFAGGGEGGRCRFAVDQRAGPCDGSGCAVCAICCGHFAVSRAGAGRLAAAVGGRLRYGRGVYFSSVSSKSDDYAAYDAAPRAAAAAAGLRVMFLCKVAAGRVLRAPADWMDDAEATVRRGGYDSLLGEPPGGPAHEAAAAAAAGYGGVGGGGMSAAAGGGGGGGGFLALNYDELVVYDSVAALPSYLIVSRP